MTIRDAILFAAVAIGLTAACMGNRTAIPLLASLMACLLLRKLHARFDPELWINIDILALAFIARKNMPVADWIILAMFPIAWAFYALPDPYRFWGGYGVVVVQFILTFPISKQQKIGWTVSHGPRRAIIYGGA